MQMIRQYQLTHLVAFNFSHQINELSFGPFYPSLENPLDNTRATTDANFYKFQYYLSVVPTIYTEDPQLLTRLSASSSSSLPTPDLFPSMRSIWTNQYAVTEQSHSVPENMVPGVFVKFDIEPITLTIAEEWGGLLALIVRLVNVISGVLVAGQWSFQLWDWANETMSRRRGRRGTDLGVLTGRRSGEYHNEKLAYD
jgi:endoplasmic reticulum-Golgi intermediate compartment protein 2